MDVAGTFVRRLREHSIDERFDRRDFARHARRSTAMHLRFLLVDGAERLLHDDDEPEPGRGTAAAHPEAGGDP